MSTIKINYLTSYKAWKGVDFDLKALTLKSAKLALGDIAKPVEFSLNLSDDEELQALNREFLGKDKPTNVLSFPSEEAQYIGDIAISFSRIAEEANEQHKEFKNHYAHMIVHAILHLMGYDHKTENEASVMEAKEILALDELGIKNPYEL
jgi:probable rRNA maturation factor